MTPLGRSSFSTSSFGRGRSASTVPMKPSQNLRISARRFVQAARVAIFRPAASTSSGVRRGAFAGSLLGACWISESHGTSVGLVILSLRTARGNAAKATADATNSRRVDVIRSLLAGAPLLPEL